jgi:hypothetical protein
MSARWLRVPVVPRFESWDVVTGVLGLLILTTARLLSERRMRFCRSAGSTVGKEPKVVDQKKRSNNKDRPRSFLQFLAETLWACGVGVMAAHWPP